ALSQQGFVPGELNTNAIVTLDMAKGGIDRIDLELQASQIDGISEEAFKKEAFLAKENCIISKALAGIQIELTVSYL
uniref:OsmC family protein n=1 Tax=Pedobacter miscanthi TaxID=2259170 RepID=UPI0039779444